jgi:hypothetical protein
MKLFFALIGHVPVYQEQLGEMEGHVLTTLGALSEMMTETVAAVHSFRSAKFHVVCEKVFCLFLQWKDCVFFFDGDTISTRNHK